MQNSKCEAAPAKHEIKMENNTPKAVHTPAFVAEKKEEAAIAKKEETATPEPEAGTNWAMIGLGAAAIGAAAYFFMKHNK